MGTVVVGMNYGKRDAITAFLNAKWLEDHKDARDFLSRVERSTGISFVVER